jgi:uncharacterized protein YecE (DUF72 family)
LGLEHGAVRLGTQGWAYKDWVGVFYPPGTHPAEYLRFYSRVFDTVEIDTTFYGPPRPETARSWFDVTPDNFVFTAKMPQSITHDRRLQGAEAELVEFLTAMSLLGPKLGPILVQLPPSFTVEERPALTRFFEILPDEFEYAVEFRHKSWLQPRTAELLTERGIAWTNIDLHYMPRTVEITAPFTYIRWLGNRRDVKRLDRIVVDRGDDLDHWAGELDRISRRLQRIYGYMNNHYAGHSPASLRDLRTKMNLEAPDPKSLWSQTSLPM